jgi:hypothetical protein
MKKCSESLLTCLYESFRGFRGIFDGRKGSLQLVTFDCESDGVSNQASVILSSFDGQYRPAGVALPR